MSNSTKTKEPKLENSDKKTIQALIAGVIGAFLLPFFFIAIPYWLDNSGISPIEALFLDTVILGVVGFILARVLIGLIFGYLAYLILKHKKPLTVISGAFFAGLLGGTIVLLLAIVFSVQ
jgi:hypothetical protein